MNRISFIVILGIMLIFAGCISVLGQEEPAPKIESAENTSTIVTPQLEPAKVCVETNNIVTYGNESYSNKCVNKTTLEITSCKDNAPSKQITTCESGYECDGGACRIIPKKCTDSDGGNNLNVTGTVTYTGITYTDYCEVGNLHEYYCTNDKMSGGTVSCPIASHCVSGQCVYWPPTCTDKGNYVKMDFHTGSIIPFYDYCKDNEILVQYYCEGNTNKSKFIYAKANESCDNSTKTIVLKECSDTDGGAIKDVSGIVKYGLDEYPDKCMGGNSVVKEYFCENGKVESVIMECKNGCTENIMGGVFGTFVGYCS